MLGSWNLKGRKNRIKELLGRLREIGKGDNNNVQEVLGDFAIDYGLKEETVQGYWDIIVKSRRVIINYGEGSWVFNYQKEDNKR